MLINFSVGNYLSFKEVQTIDFQPESLKDHPNFLHIPYLYHQEARLLKSVGVFGHNSHGKSNLMKAYRFFLDQIFRSFSLNKRAEEGFDIDHFKLSTETVNQPSYFQIEFYHREFRYRYGYKITSTKVVEEWLYYAESKVRENHLIERQEQVIRVSKGWNKEADNKINQAILFTKSSNLLLSVLISMEAIPRINDIAKWLRGNIIMSDFSEKEQLEKAIMVLSHPQFRDVVDGFIKKADLGFETIVEKIDSFIKNKISLDKNFLELLFSTELANFELYTKHSVFDREKKLIDQIPFEMLKSESSGTIKYFILACYLSWAIKNGQLILIDEIDSKFHALLLRFLLKTFHDNRTNVLGSQMIFTTHSTFIMAKNILRRDQLVVVEKDEYGESTIKRMHGAKKPIRIDTNIEKEYIEGKLGGVSEKLKKEDNQAALDL